MLHQKDMSASSATQLCEFYKGQSAHYHELATHKLTEVKAKLPKAKLDSEKKPLTDLDFFLLLKIASDLESNLGLYGLYHCEIMNRICKGERFSSGLRDELKEAPEESTPRKFLAEYDAVVTKFFSTPSTTSEEPPQKAEQRCTIT